ncbi:unnamed protein product [Dicrocoelium dendriticum]|nr:unnamed protein product [Dicrocoelium dendriticum]
MKALRVELYNLPTVVDGVCFPGITPTTATGSTQLSASADSPVVPAYSEELNLIYPANVLNSANAISSYYFESQARSATAYCSVAYRNVTACQLLANLCTLQLQRRYRITVPSSSTCAEFIRLTNVRTHKRPGFLNWVTDMPWLYYNPTKASTALTETTISLQYRPGSNLDVRLATFSLEGRFLGFENAAENGSLQLCKETLEKMRAAFQFGTFYKTECEIKADDLFNTEKYPLIFYDPYLYFYDNRTHSPQMMPIPILNRALINSAGELVNMRTVDNAPWLRGSASAVSIEASIQEKWELTRRLFLVDNVVGRTGVDVIPTTLVRYASNIELIVTTRGIGSDGHIYPPMLAVDYANLYASEAYGKNRKVRVTFSVKYVQPMANEIEFGQNLRIALGVISAVATCYAMVRTWLWSRRAGLLRLDGMLIFKLLLFAAGSIANGFLTVIYGVAIYYIIFYKMQNVFVVTLPNSDQFLVAYIASAFALKTVDLVHLLAVQTTADVFFIDWERPQLPIAGQPRPVKKADGKTTLGQDDGIIQWFLRIILWEKCFSDKLRSFADLCSVANVSVFIMSQANFGYYIHGHSPTGKSDVDLGGIEIMLATEIGGATPRRGITADSDEHTYRMALPAGVREALDRLYAPLLDIANRGASKTIGAPTRKTNANVYQALNRFLVRFISRVSDRITSFCAVIFNTAMVESRLC